MPVPTGAKASVKIAGKDLRDFGIELTAYPSIMLPTMNRREMVIPGRHGVIDFGGTYTPIEFTLTGQIRGNSHQDFVSKKSDFLAWIDHAPRITQEFLTSQQTIDALTFELSGHIYEYTTGTVAVTTGSPTVTGTGTEWETVAFGGAQFMVQGDTTVYTVQNQESDTTLTLDQNMDRATGSGLTYQLERRRYLCVNYGGSSGITNTPTSPAMFKDRVFPFNISFRAIYPFWVGDAVVTGQLDPGSTVPLSYFTLTGLGKSPINPVYSISGGTATTNPSITVAKHSMVVDFETYGANGYPLASNILNNGTEEPATASTTIKYTTGKLSQGIQLMGNTFGTQGDIISIPSASRIDFSNGTFTMWVNPWDDWNDGKDHTLWTAAVDASNELSLKKDTSNNLIFTHLAGGTSRTNTIAITEAKVAAGQWILVVCRWDSDIAIDGGSNKTQLDLYYPSDDDPESDGDPGSLGAYSGSPTIYIGGDANGENSINAWIDDVGIWEIDLSEANITDALWDTGSGAPADTVSSGSLISNITFDGTTGDEYTGTGAGDDVKNDNTFDVTVTAMPIGNMRIPARGKTGFYVRNMVNILFTSSYTTSLDQSGFVIRGIPQFPSDLAFGSNLIFTDINSSTTTLAYYRVQWNTSSTPGTHGVLRFQVRANGSTFSYDATAGDVQWKSGDYIEISGTYHKDTGCKLYFNGVKVLDDATTADTHTDDTFRVGLGQQGAVVSATNLNRFPFVWTGIAWFAQAPSEDELVKSWHEQMLLKNDSRTLTYTGTIDLGDSVNFDLHTGQHTLQDGSAGTNTIINGNVSGDPPYLLGNDSEEAIIHFPVEAGYVKVARAAHWR